MYDNVFNYPGLDLENSMNFDMDINMDNRMDIEDP